MLYLLAAVGALAIAILLWRAFGVSERVGATTKSRQIAPDDDPEFLRKLREDQQKRDRDDNS